MVMEEGAIEIEMMLWRDCWGCFGGCALAWIRIAQQMFLIQTGQCRMIITEILTILNRIMGKNLTRLDPYSAESLAAPGKRVFNDTLTIEI
jgi:hypothetical protein